MDLKVGQVYPTRNEGSVRIIAGPVSTDNVDDGYVGLYRYSDEGDFELLEYHADGTLEGNRHDEDYGEGSEDDRDVAPVTAQVWVVSTWRDGNLVSTLCGTGQAPELSPGQSLTIVDATAP